jgi:hypothetical protein
VSEGSANGGFAEFRLGRLEGSPVFMEVPCTITQGLNAGSDIWFGEAEPGRYHFRFSNVDFSG